jgi:hypothetical protein
MTTATVTKIYRAHTEGFNWAGADLSDLREWANRLNNRYDLVGKELKIWAGTLHGDTSVFESGTPDKVVIFEALHG